MISVIIPLFNAEKTIIAALESVKNQTLPKENFEIFVINDGSTDWSKSNVEKFISENPDQNITLIDQENKGVSAARNAGLRICHGDFIAFLDADDEWFADKTMRQMKIFKENNNIDFLSCRRTHHLLKYPYKVEIDNLAEITFTKLLFRNETQPSTVLFKSEILNSIGFFDEDQRYAEDHHFWLKISKNNKMFILNEELVKAGEGKRTFGVSGLSADLAKMHQGFIKNLRDMHKQKRIGFVQFLLLYLFYKVKYAVLLFRNLVLR